MTLPRSIVAVLFASCCGLPLAAQPPIAPPEPGRPAAPVMPADKRDAKLTTGTIVKADAGLDEVTRQKARAMMQKAVAYFKARQNAEQGAWSVPPEPTEAGKPRTPHYPAITGLIINGMLLDPSVSADDAAVKKAAAYMIGKQQPDGGIYDTVLPTYNTAICVSALSRIDTPEARAAVKKGVEFLRNAQWGSANPVGGSEAPQPNIARDHPFYGGIGYGNRGRPDISNAAFMLQAMHDAGVAPDDPAVQRALVFLQRLQMLEKTPDGKTVNDQPYAKGEKQGGFIYATTDNIKNGTNVGNSFAGSFEETLDDGTKVSRLRAYGSVSYAGFKSYLYAGLKKDDPRVQAVMDFLSRSYTVEENPYLGTDGLYYYYLMFSRALDAGQVGMMPVVSKDGSRTERNWRADLVNKLATLQNEDGSFKSVDDRWMENNPELITAYSLIALGHAVK